MKKKILAIVLTALMILPLSACGGEKTESGASAAGQASASQTPIEGEESHPEQAPAAQTPIEGGESHPEQASAPSTDMEKDEKLISMVATCLSLTLCEEMTLEKANRTPITVEIVDGEDISILCEGDETGSLVEIIKRDINELMGQPVVTFCSPEYRNKTVTLKMEYDASIQGYDFVKLDGDHIWSYDKSTVAEPETLLSELNLDRLEEWDSLDSYYKYEAVQIFDVLYCPDISLREVVERTRNSKLDLKIRMVVYSGEHGQKKEEKGLDLDYLPGGGMKMVGILIRYKGEEVVEIRGFSQAAVDSEGTPVGELQAFSAELSDDFIPYCRYLDGKWTYEDFMKLSAAELSELMDQKNIKDGVVYWYDEWNCSLDRFYELYFEVDPDTRKVNRVSSKGYSWYIW